MRMEFICHFLSTVRIGFQTYATSTSRLLRSCHMQAYQLAANNRDEARLHAVGTVKEYVTVQVHLSSQAEMQSVAFARIRWLQPMPQSDRDRCPLCQDMGSPGRCNWTQIGCNCDSCNSSSTIGNGKSPGMYILNSVLG